MTQYFPQNKAQMLDLSWKVLQGLPLSSALVPYPSPHTKLQTLEAFGGLLTSGVGTGLPCPMILLTDTLQCPAPSLIHHQSPTFTLQIVSCLLNC